MLMATQYIDSMVDSSSSTAMESSRNRYQEIFFKLDSLDRTISGFMFRLSLPPIVEAIYSVPANFFGLVPSVAVAPLWIAILALEDDLIHKDRQHERVTLLKRTTVFLTVVFLVAWALFQKGSMPLTRIMAQRYCYLLSIFFNVGFLQYTLLQLPLEDTAASSQKAFSLAVYFLFLWPPSILVIVVLKEAFQRRRPIVLEMARSDDRQRWLNKKTFPNICYYLARAQANESFPSGDACSATIFAILLLNISSRYILGASCIVLLACTGRMYVLAHYFFDVVAGSIIACVIHRIALSIGCGIYEMSWWHPLASTLFLATYVQTVTKNKYKTD